MKSSYKLTPITVLKILIDYFINKKTQKEISKELNIHQTNVSYYVRRYKDQFYHVYMECSEEKSQISFMICIKKKLFPIVKEYYGKKLKKRKHK